MTSPNRDGQAWDRECDNRAMDAFMLVGSVTPAKIEHILAAAQVYALLALTAAVRGHADMTEAMLGAVANSS